MRINKCQKHVSTFILTIFGPIYGSHVQFSFDRPSFSIFRRFGYQALDVTLTRYKYGHFSINPPTPVAVLTVFR